MVGGVESQRCRRRSLDGTEVAQRHGLRWNEGGGRGSVRTQRGSLIAAKEEQLVFPDRSADHTSELVPLVSIARPAHGVTEKVIRVQIPVAQEFKQIAVKLV